MRLLRACLIPCVLLAGSGDGRAQPRHHYELPRLALTLPVGFEPYRPDDRHAAVIDTFRRAPQGSVGPMVVQLLRLGGELPQRALTPDERGAFTLGTPFGFDDRATSLSALGHQLPASVGHARTPSGAGVFRIAVLLPTRASAVQLSVLSRAQDEREAREVLGFALRGAEAELTWLTTGQRALFGVATTSFAVAVLGTLVMVVRALMQGSVTHLGETAQRRISLATGLSWLAFALWLLLPLRTAEWAAAVPTLALAVTFIARARPAR